MERSTVRQNRLRLSSLTWIVGLAMAAVLVEVNLDALAAGLVAPPPQDISLTPATHLLWKAQSVWLNSGPTVISFDSNGAFEHGWPFRYLARSSHFGAWESFPSPDLIAGANGQLSAEFLYLDATLNGNAQSSRWPFDSAPIISVSRRALAANIAIALAILLGSMWTTERWSRRTGVSARFSLKAVLALTAWTGTIVALAGNDFAAWAPALAQAVLTVLLLAGIGLAWLAAVDISGLLAAAILRRRRPLGVRPSDVKPTERPIAPDA